MRVNHKYEIIIETKSSELMNLVCGLVCEKFSKEGKNWIKREKIGKEILQTIQIVILK